jgi:hypothetical protein
LEILAHLLKLLAVDFAAGVALPQDLQGLVLAARLVPARLRRAMGPLCYEPDDGCNATAYQ